MTTPVVSNGGLLKYEISKLWNGNPIPSTPDHRLNTSITLQNVANMLAISIVANFYGDPSPPKLQEGDRSYLNLVIYERAEVYFYASNSKTYLQVLMSPHGYYLVQLFNGPKNIINAGCKIEYNAKIETGTWKGEAKIPLDLLPLKVDRLMMSYFHQKEEKWIVETLYPIPGDKLDLHQPDKFGKIKLEEVLPGLKQQTQPSKVWQAALARPMIIQSINFMWDGTQIEKDHITHKGQFCTLFIKGVDEGLGIDVTCPFFNDTAPRGSPGPIDKLWDHEVAEAFFLAAYPNGTNRYTEIELGPYGHHLILLLDGFRNIVTRMLPIKYKAIIDRIKNTWVGSAIIPTVYFPPGVNKFMLSAVHNAGKSPGEVKYEVLAPMPGQTADFHRLDKYVDIKFDNLIPGNSKATMSSIWINAIANHKKSAKNKS